MFFYASHIVVQFVPLDQLRRLILVQQFTLFVHSVIGDKKVTYFSLVLLMERNSAEEMDDLTL